MAHGENGNIFSSQCLWFGSHNQTCWEDTGYKLCPKQWEENMDTSLDMFHLIKSTCSYGSWPKTFCRRDGQSSSETWSQVISAAVNRRRVSIHAVAILPIGQRHPHGHAWPLEFAGRNTVHLYRAWLAVAAPGLVMLWITARPHKAVAMESLGSS